MNSNLRSILINCLSNHYLLVLIFLDGSTFHIIESYEPQQREECLTNYNKIIQENRLRPIVVYLGMEVLTKYCSSYMNCIQITSKTPRKSKN